MKPKLPTAKDLIQKGYTVVRIANGWVMLKLISKNGTHERQVFDPDFTL